MHWYNEIDGYAAEWIRNLQKAGHLPAGAVEERSIVDVQAKDLEGITQAHFFAGIGGWPLALHLAGWPEDQEVWTGSCPCQPFSQAGKSGGLGDKRHLWPAFRRLIAERRPPVIFGEQVASKDGRKWLAGVRLELEELGYAIGGADLCSASVGAPNIRQRLWWVAYADGGKSSDRELQRGGKHGQQSKDASSVGRLVQSIEPGLERHPGNGDGRNEPGRVQTKETRSSAQAGDVGRMADAEHNGGRTNQQGRRQEGRETDGRYRPWNSYDLIQCGDGKARRIEPGTFPLAHGIPARMGRLRAYGNAINPWVAAEFIRAFVELRLC